MHLSDNNRFGVTSGQIMSIIAMIRSPMRSVSGGLIIPVLLL